MEKHQQKSLIFRYHKFKARFLVNHS